MENFIGRNIQAFRAHKGFSQEGLGNILGVSQTSISAWEDGKSLPRKVNASEFFEAFPELSHDDIFSEECGYACKTLKRARGLDMVQVPFYGAIAAGTPIEMIDVDETMPIPGHIYNAYPDSFFAARIGRVDESLYSGWVHCAYRPRCGMG